MMADPPDILTDFLPDLVIECLIGRIERAGEHQIFPHNQAVFITVVEEPVIRIEAAAPDPDRIEVRLSAVSEHALRPLRRSPRKNVVLRDIICPHGEECLTVCLCGKCLTPLIFLPSHRHRAEANSPGLPFNDFSLSSKKADRHCVKGLAAEPVRPPELWTLYLERLTVFQAEDLSVRGCQFDSDRFSIVPAAYLIAAGLPCGFTTSSAINTV